MLCERNVDLFMTGEAGGELEKDSEMKSGRASSGELSLVSNCGAVFPGSDYAHRNLEECQDSKA